MYSTNQLYKDLSESFRYLDSLVSSGTINGYGVCSNTMAFPGAADHISLEKVIESCSHPDHFAAIQVPFNLFEREAIVQEDNQTVADVAEKHGIYVTTNRPLNAIANGQIRVLVNHVLGANGKGPSKISLLLIISIFIFCYSRT